MDHKVLNIVEENFIVQEMVREIRSGTGLIESLNDAAYRDGEAAAGSVGGHFRHNLDFINSFLNGIAERRVDYSKRERDIRVERDRTYATERFEFAIRRFRSLSNEILECMILVRSEIDASQWYASTIVREVEFVLSHTVHHHALIAEKLKMRGLPTPEGFGVSSSTLMYWSQQKAA
jgi:hypothetical protein